MRSDPVPAASERTKLALLPARIRHWRRCGNEAMARSLEAELAAATGTEPPADLEPVSDLGEA